MKDIMKFPDGKKIFFTSDTHFGHRNVINFAGRPFSSVGEMDEALVDNWNKTVPKDGIIFHLGDFVHDGPSAWKRMLSKLNGTIYLVMGNHDFKNFNPGFYSDRIKLVSQQMYIDVEGQKIYLNHNPFLAYGGAYNGTWQLFGHVHSGPESKSGQDMPRLKHLFPTQYDVGVDNNNYRPISFYEVKAIMEKRLKGAEENPNLKLYHAVMEFNLGKIRAAVEGGANVNCADYENRTALQNLVYHGIKELEETHDYDYALRKAQIKKCIKYLIAEGSDPTLNPNGKPGVTEPMMNLLARNNVLHFDEMFGELYYMFEFYGLKHNLDKERILFLDIDGILTSDRNTERAKAEHWEPMPYGMDWFDYDCVRVLNNIIHYTNAKIVICSSWRELGLDKLCKIWSDYNLPGEVIDTTPEWVLTKKEAIQEWLKNHHYDAYVILDDTDMDLNHQIAPDNSRETIGLFPGIEDAVINEFDLQIK